MKTLKLFIAAIIFVGFANAVSAQTSDEATVNANANVLSFVSIEAATANANLEFGDINFDPATVLPGTDNAAQFVLTTNSNVQLTVELTENMVHQGDNSTILPFEFETDGLQITDSEGTIVTFNPNNAFNLWSTDGFNNFIIGQFNISLGGKVNPTDNQLAGNYQGTIQIRIDSSEF